MLIPTSCCVVISWEIYVFMRIVCNVSNEVWACAHITCSLVLPLADLSLAFLVSSGQMIWWFACSVIGLFVAQSMLCNLLSTDTFSCPSHASANLLLLNELKSLYQIVAKLHPTWYILQNVPTMVKPKVKPLGIFQSIQMKRIMNHIFSHFLLIESWKP